MNRVFQYLKGQPPGRLITLGFATVILLGTFLLLLPISVNPGMKVGVIDALFTATSAVCVTGLIAIDTADHFTAFGRAVVALLIQIGGLGVTSVGVGFILAAGKRVGFKGRLLVREALNVDSSKGVVRLIKAILLTTLFFEAVGAILSFIVFVQDYPPLKAMEISIFHSIAAFNNSGFDILGGLQNLIPYQSDVLLNFVTCGLIIFGGLGFLVILDVLKMRSFKKLCLHSKVVITTSGILLITGTLLLKVTEDISWLGAFFQSVSARTAGFSTYPIGEFAIDAFGRKPVYEDRGIRRRAILALGRADVGELESLIPREPGLTVIGGSSDHCIVDVEDCPRRLQVGDIVGFSLCYSHMLYATARSDMRIIFKNQSAQEE